MPWLDDRFRRQPRPYVLQSLMAFTVVVVLVVVLGALTHGAVVAALGASTFIVFAMPSRDTARPRSLIGGHLVSMALGLLCSAPLRLGWVETGVGIALLGAVAVSVSLFAMVVFDMEHPPAAGNALAFATSALAWGHVAFTLGAVLMLALIRRLLRNQLQDLA